MSSMPNSFEDDDEQSPVSNSLKRIPQLKIEKESESGKQPAALKPIKMKSTIPNVSLERRKAIFDSSVSMYVYVCMYVGMYVYMYVCMYVCMYV